MKNYKKSLLFLAIILFLMSFLSHKAVCDTTLRDTTFYPEIGDKFTWNAPGGYKYELTIEDMYDSNPYFQINTTLRYYNASISTWQFLMYDEFMVGANETQNLINYNIEYVLSAFIFLIPKPINLTMVGEYLITTYYDDYEISGKTLTLDPESFISYAITYNSNGIATKIVATIFGYSVAITLQNGGNEISFGFNFLVIAVIGVVTLVLIKKKLIK
ncbi:MAG: hypothetical protein ACFFAQ_08390 [Promethearchaeota archaeon]